MGEWAEWAYSQALDDEYAYRQRYKQLLDREAAKMSEQIKGSVHYVSEKKFDSGKSLWSIKLDNETYYGTGYVKPECEVGDLVLFKAAKNAKGYWDVEAPSTIKVKKGGGTTPPPFKGKGGFKGGGGGGGYEKDPATQASIIMQSSGKAAADVLNIAIANEAIVLPKTANKRLQALLDAYTKITSEIFQQQLKVYVDIKGGTGLDELLASDESVVEPEKELTDPDFDEDVAPTEQSAEDDGFADDPDFV